MRKCKKNNYEHAAIFILIALSFHLKKKIIPAQYDGNKNMISRLPVNLIFEKMNLAINALNY